MSLVEMSALTKMRRMSAHVGQKYGYLLVVGFPESDYLGPDKTVYPVRYECCGKPGFRTHAQLSDARHKPRRECRECSNARRGGWITVAKAIADAARVQRVKVPPPPDLLTARAQEAEAKAQRIRERRAATEARIAQIARDRASREASAMA